jgi:hypothetical protein
LSFDSFLVHKVINEKKEKIKADYFNNIPDEFEPGSDDELFLSAFLKAVNDSTKVIFQLTSFLPITKTKEEF